MQKKFRIGFDIGGTKISAGLVDSQNHILLQRKYPTPPKANDKAILKLIQQIVGELLREQNISLKNISGMGFGVPGIVNTDGTIVRTPNLNLDGFALESAIKKTFNVPARVGNDVNVGLLGEKFFGAGQGYKNVIGIFPGTGIGGAIILDNTFIMGTNGAAGELGHMIVDPHGPRCTCGNTGCLEAFAGRWAIERDIRKGLKKKKSLLTNFLKKPEDPIKSSMLAKAWNKEDPLVTGIMENMADMLGRACISLRHAIDPDAFIFGGGVIEACGNLLLPRIKKILNGDPFFSSFAACPILESQLADNAIIFGAIALLQQDTLAQQKNVRPYRPWVYIRDGIPYVDGRPRKDAFIITSAGRYIKHKMKSNKTLNLKNILNKNMGELIIGSAQEIRLSATDQELLNKNAVKLIALSPAKALQKYRTTKKLCTLLLCT